MSFGPGKCDRRVTNRAKVVRTEGVVLPEGQGADVKGRYSYIAISQANGNQEEVTRKSYLQRVRQILRSQLNGKNKVRPIKINTL